MSQAQRTQVGIVGAGPAGLTLALLLRREGLQRSRLDYLARSKAAAHSYAENYVGLPATPDF